MFKNLLYTLYVRESVVLVLMPIGIAILPRTAPPPSLRWVTGSYLHTLTITGKSESYEWIKSLTHNAKRSIEHIVCIKSDSFL